MVSSSYLVLDFRNSMSPLVSRSLLPFWPILTGLDQLLLFFYFRFRLLIFQTLLFSNDRNEMNQLVFFQIRARFLQNWKARAAKICRQPNNKIYASLSNLDESRASFAEPKIERSMKIRAPLSLSSSLGLSLFSQRCFVLITFHLSKSLKYLVFILLLMAFNITLSIMACKFQV